MPNHYTRASKKNLTAKGAKNDISSVESDSKLNSKPVETTKFDVTAKPTVHVNVAKMPVESKSPSSVASVLNDPEFDTPVKRSIQADIASEILHSNKKKCSGENNTKEHYVFSLARGGSDVVSGNENAALFRE